MDHKRFLGTLAGTTVLSLGACAHIEFNDGPKTGAVSYYESQPYVVVTIASDCTTSVSILAIPAYRRSATLHQGIGSNKLSLQFAANGTLTSVGQETDTKIPETLTAITGFAKAAGLGVAAAGRPSVPGAAEILADKSTCRPETILHEIEFNSRGGRPFISPEPVFYDLAARDQKFTTDVAAQAEAARAQKEAAEKKRAEKDKAAAAASPKPPT